MSKKKFSLQLFVGLVITMSFSDCRQDQKKKIIEFVNNEKNGLTQRITDANEKEVLLLQYQPADYRYFEEAMTVKQQDKIPDSLEKAYERFYHFKLVINNQVGQMSNTIMNYVNFGIQENIALATQKDTMIPAICQRIPGMDSKQFIYMIAFERPVEDKNDPKDLNFMIMDSVLGIGNKIISISKRSLKELNDIK